MTTASNALSQYHEELDASAYIFAKPGATLFKHLPAGAVFVFDPANADKPSAQLLRTKNGYRTLSGGRQFTTGARTACYVLHNRHA